MRRLLSCASLLWCTIAHGQTVDVTAQIQVNKPSSAHKSMVMQSQQVVVWLTPLSSSGMHAVTPGSFRLEQKDKMFQPHLLVVPMGSEVTFPNLDPFFHNVFSLFNGKRFDLGLYQTGSSKDVRFNHEGVSFIFCNIHPEMSAVVVTLATPYYSIADADGTLVIHNVPPGNYKVSIWSEGIDSQQLAALDRTVSISTGHTDLGSIRLVNDVAPTPHKNKFGQDYSPDAVLY